MIVIPSHRTARGYKKIRNKRNVFYSGVPDVLVYSAVSGFVPIEIKTSRGVVSPVQQEFIDACDKMALFVLVARSLDDVINHFK